MAYDSTTSASHLPLRPYNYYDRPAPAGRFRLDDSGQKNPDLATIIGGKEERWEARHAPTHAHETPGLAPRGTQAPANGPQSAESGHSQDLRWSWPRRNRPYRHAEPRIKVSCAGASGGRYRAIVQGGIAISPNNGGDTIQLVDPVGMVIDEVAYGTVSMGDVIRPN